MAAGCSSFVSVLPDRRCATWGSQPGTEAGTPCTAYRRRMVDRCRGFCRECRVAMDEARAQFDAFCYKLDGRDRKSTRLNSSHVKISYAVFCLKKKKIKIINSSWKS